MGRALIWVNPLHLERRVLISEYSPEWCSELLRPHVVPWGQVTRNRPRRGPDGTWLQGRVRDTSFVIWREPMPIKLARPKVVGHFTPMPDGIRIDLKIGILPRLLDRVQMGMFLAIPLIITALAFTFPPTHPSIFVPVLALLATIVMAVRWFWNWRRYRNDGPELVAMLGEWLSAREVPADYERSSPSEASDHRQ